MISEQAHEVTAKVAVAAGGGTAVWGYLEANWMGLVGLLIATATFAVNWYYKHKHLKLAQSSQDDG